MRISREEMYLEIALTVAKRSTCNRAQVGAVFVRDGRPILTGYNGSASGQPHCIDVGCLDKGRGCERTLHAEAGAISYAAGEGISLKGSTLYVTHSPCRNCADHIINSGVTKVFYLHEYRITDGIDTLNAAGIPCLKSRFAKKLTTSTD